MALHLLEADVCHGCGQPHSESTAIENEFEYTATAEKCHACAKIRREQRAFTTAAGESPSASDGVSFRVTRDGG